MEDIDLSNQTSNKKKNIKIWIVVVVSILACLACYFVVDALLNVETRPKLEVTGTSMSVEYNEYLGYSAKIIGTAKNPTNKKYSYAQIEFSVYDASGNNLGTALANINNLSSGDTWNFEASLLSFPSSRPTSYKLVDITAW